jgi:hypothetical protein
VGENDWQLYSLYIFIPNIQYLPENTFKNLVRLGMHGDGKFVEYDMVEHRKRFIGLEIRWVGKIHKLSVMNASMAYYRSAEPRA